METSLVRSSFDARPKKCRSAVTNGRRLHVVSPPDGKWSRRFRDVFDQILADLGAEVSEGQRQLVRRAATISIECEKLECIAAAGDNIDLDVYGALTDRLGRTLARLGVKRDIASYTRPPTLEDSLVENYKRLSAEAGD
jgi:hypothetical protein